jgi:hypothetical protein
MFRHAFLPSSGRCCDKSIETVYHTVNTSPKPWVKTHHIIASHITPHTLNNFQSQQFTDYLFLAYIYFAGII